MPTASVQFVPEMRLILPDALAVPVPAVGAYALATPCPVLTCLLLLPGGMGGMGGMPGMGGGFGA
eukprot:3638095-Rhodomonas_salina.1